MWWKNFVPFICRIKVLSPLQQADCQTPLSRARLENLEDFPMEMQSPMRAVWFAHGKATQSCDCYKGCLSAEQALYRQAACCRLLATTAATKGDALPSHFGRGRL